MRAAFFERFGPAQAVLQVGEVEAKPPGPGAVCVALQASGINPYDVKFRAGRYAATLPRAPFIAHCDGAGVICEIGAGIDPARLGERVWVWGAAQGEIDGTAAQFVTLPAERAVPMPAALSFEAGACLGIPYLTAYQNLLRDGPVAGQTVFVSGGGGAVGFLAIQLARLSGASVLASAATPETIAHAEAAGAQAVIDYRRDDVAERVFALTSGNGVDRVIEVEFGRNLPLFTTIVRPGGIVSSYGSASEMTPRFDFGAVQAHGLTLHFRSVHRMDDGLRDRAIADLPGFLDRGFILPPTRGYALSDIAAAHEAVEAGAGVTRVVLRIEETTEADPAA